MSLYLTLNFSDDLPSRRYSSTYLISWAEFNSCAFSVRDTRVDKLRLRPFDLVPWKNKIFLWKLLSRTLHIIFQDAQQHGKLYLVPETESSASACPVS